MDLACHEIHKLQAVEDSVGPFLRRMKATAPGEYDRWGWFLETNLTIYKANVTVFKEQLRRD